MYNKKVLIDALKNLGSAKAPAKKKDIITDPEGQWKFPGQPTRIPSNEITMKGVPYPVLGKGSDGSEQMMYPGAEYMFPGSDYVDEYPMMQPGGQYTPKERMGVRQNPGATTPEEWEQEIRAVESQIGNPSGWALQDYNLLQNKLNDYRSWRENTPKGQAVIDSHNVKGEYNIPLPEHLQNYTNAMMKARLAYANEFGNPAAQRMIVMPDQPYDFGNGYTGTHYMSSIDNYAVPQIQDKNGQLVLGDYGPKSNEAIRFDNPDDAQYFAEHYKEVAPGFVEAELTDKEIEKYRRGGYIIEELPQAQLGKEVGKFLQTIGKLKLPWTSAVTPTINNLNNQLGVINDNSKFINDGLLDSHLINPSSTVLSPMRTAESVSHKMAAKKRDLDLSAFSPGNYKQHADNFISAALYPFMGPAIYKSAELYNMIMPPGYRTEARNTIIGHMKERLGNQYYDQMLDPNEPLNLWDNNTTYYLGKKYGVDWNQAMDGWIERHNQSVIDRNQSRRKFLKDDLQKEWARENNLQWWYDNGKLQTSDSEDYMVFPPTEKSLEWDKIVDEKYPLIDQYPTITKSGIYTDAISRPLTMFLKDETTPGNHLYRKIGNKSGLKDLIDKNGAQAPKPFRMKSGITVDTPFFGKGSNPSRDYKGMFAVELDPKAKGKYNWSSYVGGTSNYGVAPFDQKGLVKNIPLDDLNVYRRKWFSNKYKKLDKEKLEKELKNADAQWWAENLWKWGYRGAAADYYLNEGKITRNLLGLDEKAVGGEVISLGDEVDEATMKQLKAQGYTFEEI